MQPQGLTEAVIEAAQVKMRAKVAKCTDVFYFKELAVTRLNLLAKNMSWLLTVETAKWAGGNGVKWCLPQVS